MSVNAISQANATQPRLQGIKPQSAGHNAFANVFVNARANGLNDQTGALNVNAASATQVGSLDQTSLGTNPANSGLNGNSGKDFSAIFANAQNSLQDLQITNSSFVNQTNAQTLSKLDLNSSLNINNAGLATSLNTNAMQATNVVENVANITAPKSEQNAWGVDDYYLMQALQMTPRTNQGADELDGNSIVDLQNLSLDFSSLLPAGTRDFLKKVQGDAHSVDQVVNTMLFGKADGPQGLKASEYFGKDSMSKAELSSNLQVLLDQARINTQHVTAQDINFVLKDSDAVFGQNLASFKGESLNARAMERNLESVYQNDMALMQLVSRSNNQSANIF